LRPQHEEILRLLARLPQTCNDSSTKRKSNAPVRESELTQAIRALRTEERSLLTFAWLELQRRYWKPRLNPAFVTWLMNLPPGWVSTEPLDSTSYGRWEIQWSQLARLLLS
jgi:hypothetical protein